eukprot:CAMPEP_0119379920 /NCGR_PEP_ID=MMETSP1334-20130426/54682_1 /TAXON_ID=127549 /ORGANISM="Calcidiscus leptoporus, Strain RCC1130" /LENGTH=222 /DNA_ID=CAMNT_0007399569 /DNA_START=104 /DNA_END=773 /DNA_ORIENTATION=+
MHESVAWGEPFCVSALGGLLLALGCSVFTFNIWLVGAPLHQTLSVNSDSAVSHSSSACSVDIASEPCSLAHDADAAQLLVREVHTYCANDGPCCKEHMRKQQLGARRTTSARDHTKQKLSAESGKPARSAVKMRVSVWHPSPSPISTTPPPSTARAPGSPLCVASATSTSRSGDDSSPVTHKMARGTPTTARPVIIELKGLFVWAASSSSEKARVRAALMLV